MRLCAGAGEDAEAGQTRTLLLQQLLSGGLAAQQQRQLHQARPQQQRLQPRQRAGAGGTQGATAGQSSAIRTRARPWDGQGYVYLGVCALELVCVCVHARQLEVGSAEKLPPLAWKGPLAGVVGEQARPQQHLQAGRARRTSEPYVHAAVLLCSVAHDTPYVPCR